MDIDGSRNLISKPQEDDSFLENLKAEWKLFWHGIIGDDEGEASSKEAKDPFSPDRLRIMTIEQIKQIMKALSQDRKRLNQKIEQVQKEIDTLSENIESQTLVGADTDSTIEQIKKLTDVGHLFSQQLEKVNTQIAKFREREMELKA